MTALEGIGGKIRRRREELGLKQADIASALQLTAQAVSKWERGENAPDITLLGQLCRILGVSVDWLLGLYEENKDVFEATVLVSGVRGFARKAASMPPADVAAWANGFFYHLTEAALKHGGVPVKQIGDGMLCFFSGARHGDRAVAAARRAVETGRDSMTVALVRGEVYLGSLGHPDYTHPDIMGSTVNVAFLLLAADGSGAVGSGAVGSGAGESDSDTSVITATANVVENLEEKAPFAGPYKRNISLLGRDVAVYEIRV
ncbi:MAG: helix-turn-helix domain-containing protein [Nitrospinota bacterium]|nr:helix-turn-helix domain-containing protein [Nitrospinota bacterium]